MKIIGFTGRAGCGKDTAVKALQLKYTNFFSQEAPYHYSFAGPLRRGLAAMLGGEVEMQSHDPVRKNEVIEAYGVSPRTLLQTLGTEWGRHLINDDIWIIRAKQIWQETNDINPNAIILISDCRFDNEAQAIRDMGGEVIEIARPNNPHTSAINSGGVANHASEAGVDPKLISYTITNHFNLITDFESRIINDQFITSYLKGTTS